MSGIWFGMGRERVKNIKRDWPYVKVSDEYMEVITVFFLLLYILEISIRFVF